MLADAGVPRHLAARPGHLAAARAARRCGPTSGRSPAWRGRRSGRWSSLARRRPRVVVVGRRLRQLPGRRRRRGPAGAAGPGQHRRRAGAVNRLLGRFAAASAVAFPGTDAAPGRGHRHAGAGRAGRRRPVAGGRSPPPGAARDPGRPAGASAVFGGSLGCPAHQRGRGRAGRAVGATGRPADLPRDRAAGLGRAFGHAGRGRQPDRWSRARYRVVPFEDRMAVLYARRRRDGLPGRGHDGGRAGRGRGRRPSWCRCPAPPGTTRRRTPRPWSTPGAAVLVPDDECDGPRLAPRPRHPAGRPEPAGRHGRGGRAASATPTPPPGWPSWWRPMPAERRRRRAACRGPRPPAGAGGSTSWGSAGPG